MLRGERKTIMTKILLLMTAVAWLIGIIVRRNLIEPWQTQQKRKEKKDS